MAEKSGKMSLQDEELVAQSFEPQSVVWISLPSKKGEMQIYSTILPFSLGFVSEVLDGFDDTEVWRKNIKVISLLKDERYNTEQ